jgi:hypothetical protein
MERASDCGRVAAKNNFVNNNLGRNKRWCIYISRSVDMDSASRRRRERRDGRNYAASSAAHFLMFWHDTKQTESNVKEMAATKNTHIGELDWISLTFMPNTDEM